MRHVFPSRLQILLAHLLVATALACCAGSAAAQPTLKDLLAPAGSGEGAADTETEKGAAQAEPEPPPEDEFNRGVPRTAVDGYLLAAEAGDYERAAEYLDLRKLPKGDRGKMGPELARELKIVLDRQLWIEPSSLSSKPEGRKSHDLRPTQERVGKMKTARGPVYILLERVRRDDGIPVWKFSSDTVARIPALYAEFGYGPLGEMLPEPFFEIRFLKVQLWQWIGLVLLAVASAFASLAVAGLVVRVLGPLTRRARTDVGERLVRFSRGPLRLAVFASLFSAGKAFLGLSVTVLAVINALEKVLLIVTVTWAFFRLLDAVAQVVIDRLLWRGQSSVVLIVPPARRAAKVILVTIALIASLDNFGYNVTTLVAGLGVGGIAVALAAQKSVENLFGGITLYADQPVRVGDFCRFGQNVGTIEDIGLRSTRVRTPNRTVVSVPNAEFANLQIENFGRRDKFWFHPTIGLRCETTPDQLRYLLVELRRMLYAHPKVDSELARARFVGFGAYSLDVEISGYVSAADYNEYLEIAEDLNLRIMEIVAQAGSGFAFPSQTQYASSEGFAPELAREAERRVEEWRQQDSLFLPRFPREKIKELDNTLDYPPKGSAMAKRQADGKRR